MATDPATPCGPPQHNFIYSDGRRLGIAHNISATLALPLQLPWGASGLATYDLLLGVTSLPSWCLPLFLPLSYDDAEGKDKIPVMEEVLGLTMPTGNALLWGDRQ